jgi:hypothetical protein
MGRMRWMTDAAGRTVATCPRCGREAPADPARTFYCDCRSRRARTVPVACEVGAGGGSSAPHPPR